MHARVSYCSKIAIFFIIHTRGFKTWNLKHIENIGLWQLASKWVLNLNQDNLLLGPG
jgi:hypothetical protein